MTILFNALKIVHIILCISVIFGVLMMNQKSEGLSGVMGGIVIFEPRHQGYGRRHAQDHYVFGHIRFYHVGSSGMVARLKAASVRGPRR